MANNIFFGLNIGRSALLAQQAALDVTGHNLANVETEGYSRQRASLVQAMPIQSPQGPMGSGVDLERIQRLQAGYMDRQYLQAKTQSGFDSALVLGLDELQTLLGEPSSDGIGQALTDFWNSWEDLSSRPADASLRAQVLDRAEHLATVYNGKIQSFQDAEASYEDSLSDDMAEVNSLTEKLASLNAAVAKLEVGGYTANDLRDQRDLVARQIAEKLGVEVEADGSYLNLRIPGQGPYLVNRVNSFDLEADRDASGEIAGFRVGVAPVKINTGEMGALLELRDEVSPWLRDQLSSLVATAADRVNRLHVSAYDRDGEKGLNLFSWEGGGGSVTLAPSSGLSEVAADSGLAAGTHHLEVSSVTLEGNGGETAPAGSIQLQVAGGTYSGPLQSTDYHVRVVGSGTFQLYRGDEAVGAAQSVSGSGPATLTWDNVDGVNFQATIDPTAGFTLGQRSAGFKTTGLVSLDGGPAVAVDFAAALTYSFDGGPDSGYVAGGAANVTFSGGAFSGGSFTLYDAAGSLRVNPAVAADTDKLAAAAPGPGGGPGASGGGEIARRIASLATEGIFEGIGETPAGFLGLMVQGLGAKGRDAQVQEQASGSILVQIETQRQGLVGVNMDEEMVQLLQYQRGFEAAARFLTTVDSLIDTLVNRVGLVGR